jgi:hypothetical protein
MKETVTVGETEVVVALGDGDDGPGWYYWPSEHPDEAYGAFITKEEAVRDAVESIDLELAYEPTARGFRCWGFTDRYGNRCSLQKSSLATDSAIWLGCDDPAPKVLVHGQGWQPVKLPEGTSCNTRMHLTLGQVRQLLPMLQHFAETGELPDGETT